MPVSEYLASVVKPILGHPDYFKVTQSVDEMGVLLSVEVHKDDMGLILGRHGETAKSIRHMVRIVGMSGRQRVSVRINEPEGSTYKRKQFDNEW